eukprot:m.75685 g.75685  ORF g.75685 m.75685 type:complete len:232 (+) comp14489_c0_seq1:212-907(+)
MGKKADVSPDKFLRKGEGPRARVEPQKREFKSTKPGVPRRHEKVATNTVATARAAAVQEPNPPSEQLRQAPLLMSCTHMFPSLSLLQPVMGLKSNKNFVHTNAVENITAVPKKRSTSAKKFTQKEDFGRVPDYLRQRKQEEQSRFEATQKQIQEMQADTGMYRIPDQERVELLSGMKKNFETLRREYLNLPVLVDTPNKKSKKLRLEEQLAVLESDIDKLERHSVIYVSEY